MSDTTLLKSHGISDRKTFNRWALKNHPDKGGDLKKFQEVQSAYRRVISEPAPVKQPFTAPPSSWFTPPAGKAQPAKSSARGPNLNPNWTRANVDQKYFPAGVDASFFDFFKWAPSKPAKKRTKKYKVVPPTRKCETKLRTCWRPCYGETRRCYFHQPDQPCETVLLNLYGQNLFDTNWSTVCPAYTPRHCHYILADGKRCRKIKPDAGSYCGMHQRLNKKSEDAAVKNCSK
jgi:hypothetical protein